MEKIFNGGKEDVKKKTWIFFTLKENKNPMFSVFMKLNSFEKVNFYQFKYSKRNKRNLEYVKCKMNWKRRIAEKARLVEMWIKNLIWIKLSKVRVKNLKKKFGVFDCTFHREEIINK